jgi:hypothetical protein
MTYFNMSGTASYAAFPSYTGARGRESFGAISAVELKIPE